MLFILVAILFSGHFFAYFSLVKFLDIESTKIRLILGLILFIFGISFILSSILAHYNENIFTKGAYFISGLWLGAGWNLLIAFLFSWIIIGFLKIFDFSFDYKYLAIFSFVFTFIYSGYGIWSAYNPKIKNITVEMENLPIGWKNKKAVQLSDVHLGHIYGEKALSKLVEKTNAQKPDLVFFTGDLFDGMDGELDFLVGPLNNISAPDGIYFVTGNHETYLGVDKSMEVLRKTPVKVLNNKLVNVDEMQILGVSYPERGTKENVKEVIRNMKNFNAKEPGILLYHSPSEVMSAKEAGINLQLSGHTHSGQLFPFQFITRLIYGKYHYGFFQEDNFSIYTSMGVGTWGPMMRTSGRPEIVVISFK